ncbi:MAG: 4'-phosphopantetheinyl transferase superfamily protein [Bacilli bacterium]|nr:4'-phosphopantetheinyl transferase superfamily protein [Bacilli bacterium]
MNENITNQIYYAKIKPLFNEKRYEQYYALMPKKRQEKINKYINQEDKIRSVASFFLLIKLLEDNKIKYTDESFLIDENGKPYLKGNPVYFNISHRGKYVMAAISASPIGVDVEFMKRGVDVHELGDKVFNANEINEFHHAMNKRVFFYQIWTLKESYLKCIGKGLSIAMPSLDFSESKYQGYFFKIFMLKNHQFAITSKSEAMNIKEIKL